MGWVSGSLLLKRRLFERFISFKVGLGEDIRFWEDCWCSDCILKEDFLNIFSFAIDAQSRVVDNFDSVGGGVWCPRICRNLNDWEVGKWFGLIQCLGHSRLDPNVSDSWKWVAVIGIAFLPNLFMKGCFLLGLMI